MIRIFETDAGKVVETRDTESIMPGMWIELTSPTNVEADRISGLFNIDRQDLLAAIDPEEKNRVELLDGYTLILVDIPSREKRHNEYRYTTLPLGIILTRDYIITVCSVGNPVLAYFHHSHSRDFSTKNRLRFVYQILMRDTILFQRGLREIDKRRTSFEESIETRTDEKDLINLHELESTLVYFATSLRGNGNVMNRLTRYSRIRQSEEDKELLDDVIIENEQAIEMSRIYRDILDGTRELLSTLLNDRLNQVMKRLTSITLILAVPTMISGMYGMNVDGRWMPLSRTPNGFGIIGAIIIAICAALTWYLHKKKML